MRESIASICARVKFCQALHTAWLQIGTAVLIEVLIALLPHASRGQSTSVSSPQYPASCGESNPDVLREIAAASRLIRAKSPDKAIALLQRAHEQCPMDEQISQRLASAEIEAGNYDAAQKMLQELLLRGDRADLHDLLGRIAAAEKNWKTAAVEYQKAATMAPTEENVFNFGTALSRLDLPSAAKILRYGMGRYPQSARMRVALATVLYAQDAVEEGAALLCEAAEMDPSDPHPLEILAETEIVPASIQPRAAHLLEALHRMYPADTLIFFDLLMVRSKRWSGSPNELPPYLVSSLRSILVRNPRMPQPWYQLALIDQQQHHFKEEVAALTRAVALEPGKAVYHYKLAFALREVGDQGGFERELRRYQELHAPPASAP